MCISIYICTYIFMYLSVYTASIFGQIYVIITNCGTVAFAVGPYFIIKTNYYNKTISTET